MAEWCSVINSFIYLMCINLDSMDRRLGYKEARTDQVPASLDRVTYIMVKGDGQQINKQLYDKSWRALTRLTKVTESHRCVYLYVLCYQVSRTASLMKGHLAETWRSDPCEWAGKITPDRIVRCWGKSCVRNQGQHSWTGVRWQGGGGGRQEQETTGRLGGPCTCEWGIWFYSVRVGCHCRIWKDLIWCWAPRFSGHFRRWRTDTTYARRNQGGRGEAMSIVSMRDHRWVGYSSCVPIPRPGRWDSEWRRVLNEWVILYSIYVNSAKGKYRRKLISLYGKGGRNVKEFHLDA